MKECTETFTTQTNDDVVNETTQNGYCGRGISRVTKSENFPDSKIFVAKTFWIKPVNCIIFQIRDKYA